MDIMEHPHDLELFCLVWITYRFRMYQSNVFIYIFHCCSPGIREIVIFLSNATELTPKNMDE